jgi:nitrite reductase/ring-hydroxylating ferredoxin subunit
VSELITLCRVDDVPVNGARSFSIGDRSLIVLRSSADTVRVFLNRCPHLGTPLNWEDNDFLDPDGEFIQCSTHGALFEKDSGLCVLGPCRDESLWNIDCQISNNMVMIDPVELPTSNLE